MSLGWNTPQVGFEDEGEIDPDNIPNGGTFHEDGSVEVSGHCRDSDDCTVHAGITANVVITVTVVIVWHVKSAVPICPLSLDHVTVILMIGWRTIVRNVSPKVASVSNTTKATPTETLTTTVIYHVVVVSVNVCVIATAVQLLMERQSLQ